MRSVVGSIGSPLNRDDLDGGEGQLDASAVLPNRVTRGIPPGRLISGGERRAEALGEYGTMGDGSLFGVDVTPFVRPPIRFTLRKVPRPQSTVLRDLSDMGPPTTTTTTVPITRTTTGGGSRPPNVLPSTRRPGPTAPPRTRKENRITKKGKADAVLNKAYTELEADPDNLQRLYRVEALHASRGEAVPDDIEARITAKLRRKRPPVRDDDDDDDDLERAPKKPRRG